MVFFQEEEKEKKKGKLTKGSDMLACYQTSRYGLTRGILYSKTHFHSLNNGYD